MTSEPDARTQTSAAVVPPPVEPPIVATADEPPEPSRWARTAEVLVALGVIVIGIVVLIETRDIRVAKSMARVGPRVIPNIIGAGMILIGIWYAIDALRGSGATIEADAEDIDPTLPADWRTIAGIGVALIVYMVTIERLGFIIASALLFVITAFSMGSRSYLRDIAVGILIGVGVYLAFSGGLGVRLPQGILEGLG